MADVAIGHYIRFKDKCGNYINQRNFQNFFVGETRTWQSNVYLFAPFVISGSTSSRNGDGSTASLVTIPNDLTVGICVEAVQSRWLVEVRTVNITCTEGEPYSESQNLSQEVWNTTSYSQDNEKITINLSSPLDATRLQVPKRVLNQYLVGAVPSTGVISSR